MVQNFVPVKDIGTKMQTIGHRLAEERKRLGYNQPDFGQLGGVKKGTIINWEKGLTSPTGDFLSEIAKVGADINYIITGKRIREVLEPRAQALIDNYLNSSDKDKKVIESVAFATAKPDEKIETPDLKNSKKA